ncbi:MAG: ABC transporter substrate-binding protein [Armatimonadetes bacterium]|nr:ABC transporter substrate-binding protein [Armatimonadota bacterium]
MRLRIGAVVVLLAMMLGAAPPGAAGPAPRVTFMLDWFPNPNHVPVYAALQRGFLKAAGVDVTVQVPADPNDPLKLVAAGKVDLAISYQPAVVIARAEGLPVVTVGLLVDHPLTTVMFLRGSGIGNPADLRGKTVGYAVAGFEEAMLVAIAARAGLKKGDYRMVNVGFNLTPALLGRKVDAVVGAYKNYERIQIELQGRQVGMFEVEKYGVPDYYELVIIASERVVRERPETVARFVRALTQGIRHTLASQDDAWKAYVAANPKLNDTLNRRGYAATLPFYARGQRQSAPRWTALADFLHAHGIIKRKTPVEAMFTNRFVPAP